MTENNRLQKHLVYGTWGLVIASLIGAGILWYYNSRQLKEIQKSTELSWRPFLNITQTPYIVVPYFRLGETPEKDTVIKDIDSLALNSAEYLAVRWLGYIIPRNIKYRNSGATPLRIRRTVISTISKDEWFDNFGKSAERFVAAIQADTTLKSSDIDLVVFPDSVYQAPDTTMGIKRRMGIKLFEKCLWKDSAIILYPYTYVEYEDFFGHQYNALVMQFVIQKLDTTNNHIVFKDSAAVYTEKYRWDIEAAP